MDTNAILKSKILLNVWDDSKNEDENFEPIMTLELPCVDIQPDMEDDIGYVQFSLSVEGRTYEVRIPNNLVK